MMAGELTSCMVYKLSLPYRTEKIATDVYRRCTKGIAAMYLDRFPDLSDEQIVDCMISDYRSLRRSVYFLEWIKAMLYYQRNAMNSLGYMVFG